MFIQHFEKVNPLMPGYFSVGRLSFNRKPGLEKINEEEGEDSPLEAGQSSKIKIISFGGENNKINFDGNPFAFDLKEKKEVIEEEPKIPEEDEIPKKKKKGVQAKKNIKQKKS